MKIIVFSALVGFLLGLASTILTEIIKKSAKKKVVASKLLTASMLTLKEILEVDFISIVAVSKKIYSTNNISSSQKSLDIYLKDMKARMKADKKTYDTIKTLKKI